MRQLFNQLMGKKPTMLTPSQMAMQEAMGGFQQAWDGLDTPPKLIDKKAGEKSLAPVRDRGLTVGEQRRLREQGRPDLADAQYDSSGKQWVLPTNESMDASRIDPSRVNASDGQGWVRATPPNAADKNTLIDAMSPETRAVAPVPTWKDFMARNPQLGTPEGQKFLDRHPGIDGGARTPDTGGLIKGADPVFDIGGQTAPRGALGMDTGGGMGSMAMGALGGASGALDGIMSDAQKNVGGGIKDNFDSRNPIRDATLARARSGQAVPMRGLRYGGYVAPGEEVLVGEVAPEKVIARPDGGVDVVPLDDPEANARNIAAGVTSLQNIGQASAEGRRYKEPPPPNLGAIRGTSPLGGEYAPTADASGREPMSGEGGIAMDAPEAMADEGAPPPPRRSLLDTKRIIARNNDGLTDEGVWNAREDVLKEDQWRALNEPVKKSKWKDIGMMLLTSLNNQVNNRQDPVRTWGEIKRDEKVGALAPQLQVLQQRRAEKEAQAQAKMQRDLGNARIQDYKDDAENKRLETARKANDTVVRERTNRMNVVSRMLKDLPEFIPGDPKFKDIEEALGDVGLPITQKDAKKKVDLKQDQRTGEWTVILTNPVTSQQEVRNVIKDGKTLTTTPTVVMQGELGLIKQNDQQTYQAGENAKNRAQEMEKFQQTYNDKIRQDILNKQFDATKEMGKLKQALDAGELDQESFTTLMNMIQANMESQRTRAPK